MSLGHDEFNTFNTKRKAIVILTSLNFASLSILLCDLTFLPVTRSCKRAHSTKKSSFDLRAYSNKVCPIFVK